MALNKGICLPAYCIKTKKTSYYGFLKKVENAPKSPPSYRIKAYCFQLVFDIIVLEQKEFPIMNHLLFFLTRTRPIGRKEQYT